MFANLDQVFSFFGGGGGGGWAQKSAIAFQRKRKEDHLITGYTFDKERHFY